MKYLAILFSVLSFAVSAQSDPDQLSRTQYDTVDMPGKTIPAYQSSAKSASDSELKHVGRCSYALTFRNNVLYSTVVRVKGRTEQQNLAEYYTKLTGEQFQPVYIGKTRCVQKITADGVPVLAVFESVNRRRGKLTLTAVTG